MQENAIKNIVVPKVGLEPTCLAAEDFESSASTIPPLGPVFRVINLKADVNTSRCFLGDAAWPPVWPLKGGFSLTRHHGLAAANLSQADNLPDCNPT